MTSTMTYLLDAALGRSAVKLKGKPGPAHMEDPCEFCPNNHTPSGVVTLDGTGSKLFLCPTCAALANTFDIDGMTEKLRREITAAGGPAPWWLWKKERYRRQLTIKNTAMDIAHSYFSSMLPGYATQEGPTP